MGLDFTAGTIFDVDGNFNLGWSLTVNSPITVDGLGLFDEIGFSAAGLTDAHTVGLWNATGTLLRQTTITNASTPVASGSSLGQWLFGDIVPIALTPGAYVLGAFYPTTSDFVVAEADITTAPEITYGTSLASTAGSFEEPGTFGLFVPGVFGPNLRVTTTPPAGVPEPGILLLVCAALVGLYLSRLPKRA